MAQTKRVSELPIVPDAQLENVDIFVYNRISGDSERAPFAKLQVPAQEAADEISRQWDEEVRPAFEDAIDYANSLVDGTNGWNPIFQYVVVDDNTIVSQLVGYEGGTGDEPTANVGKYAGEEGLVDSIEDAINFKANDVTSLETRVTNLENNWTNNW